MDEISGLQTPLFQGVPADATGKRKMWRHKCQGLEMLMPLGRGRQ